MSTLNTVPERFADKFPASAPTSRQQEAIPVGSDRGHRMLSTLLERGLLFVP